VETRYPCGSGRYDGLATLLADLLSFEEERIDARTAALRSRYRPPGGAGRGADRPVVRGSGHHQPACRLVRSEQGCSCPGGRGPASPLRPGNPARGGRPDLAGSSRSAVHRPTLLIVGARIRSSQSTRRSWHTSPGRSTSRSSRGVAPCSRNWGALEQVARLCQRRVRPVSDPPGIPKPGPGSHRLMGG